MSESHPEQQYLDLMRRIWSEGDERMDRTGVGTRSVFGARDAAMEHIIRLRFEPGDWNLDGLQAGDNTAALMKAPVLSTVLASA